MTLVVILAGGEASRMGGDKPLRQLASERLIDRALRHARRWSDDVRVALRKPVQVPGLDAPVLIDAPDVWGPLAGLTTALQAARAEGRRHVLTLPCDMPFLPRDMGPRLAAAIGDHGVAMAVSGDQLHPVCALWRVEALDAIPAYLAGGRRSLKGLAATVGMVIVDWPEAGFANVNTPEELAEAERRLASEGKDLDEGSRL